MVPIGAMAAPNGGHIRTNILGSGQSLQIGQSISSSNGQFMLSMGNDGNLVEYQMYPHPFAKIYIIDYDRKWET